MLVNQVPPWDSRPLVGHNSMMTSQRYVTAPAPRPALPQPKTSSTAYQSNNANRGDLNGGKRRYGAGTMGPLVILSHNALWPRTEIMIRREFFCSTGELTHR